MSAETINIAEAKKRFSALIGQVAYGKKEILITKRGKPMARIVPAIESETHLGDAKGWLENDDPFFHVYVRTPTIHLLPSIPPTTLLLGILQKQRNTSDRVCLLHIPRLLRCKPAFPEFVTMKLA